MINELETSVGFLKKGFADLQNLGQGNDFYDAPIFSLSFGIEKFLKSIIVIANWDDEDKLKKIHKKWRSSKGHKLENLLETVIEIVEENKYSLKRPIAKIDLNFITNNPDLNDLISVLSKFSQGGRYYNLDVIMTGTSSFTDPRKGWEEIQNEIFSKRKDLQRKLADDLTFDHLTELVKDIVVILETFLRAISRFFTLAELGPLAKRMSPIIFDFLMLKNSDIGKRDYNNYQRYPRQQFES